MNGTSFASFLWGIVSRKERKGSAKDAKPEASRFAVLAEP